MTDHSVKTSHLHDHLRGLYLILDQQWASRRSLVEILNEAATVGVRLVQYRNKFGSGRDVYQQALLLREAAAKNGIVFILNDRCDLAMAVKADGVHLGQSDLPLVYARSLMGPDRIIGISTHRKEDVLEASSSGADYIGFGPIFPTSTKSDHEPIVGIEGLKDIRTITSLPIFAIGGVTSESVERLLSAGADGVAVASAILGESNSQAAVKSFMRYLS